MTTQPEALRGEEDRGERLKKWLEDRGFKPERWWQGEGYGYPALQPGGLAPRGDTGDPEVRQRVIDARRARLLGHRSLKQPLT